ncbi:MAG TPA: cbb3-type cytochrome oxidase assembly protein CcoS [Myxococcota bacterium]|nr:cbb3-type cytochrome oxidase assembly protein CcoS [Myxococcota bacterium]
MSFLWITIPATLVLAASLLGWVLLEIRNGGLDDLEAPAVRAARDDDSTPERPGGRG